MIETLEQRRARRLAASRKQRAAMVATVVDGSKSREWLTRWEREFRGRWVERAGKFYPVEMKP